MQEIQGLLRHGVAVVKISTQFSLWSSALLNFFLHSQTGLNSWHETSLSFTPKQISMESYKILIFVVPAASPSWLWWFCLAIPGKKKNKKKKQINVGDNMLQKEIWNLRCFFPSFSRFRRESFWSILLTEMNKRLVSLHVF